MRDKDTTQGNKTMTRTQLIAAFLHNSIVKHMGSEWTIESLEREDGSGFCFILTLQNVHTNRRMGKFIRTSDHPHVGRVGHPKHSLSKPDANGRNVAFPV